MKLRQQVVPTIKTTSGRVSIKPINRRLQAKASHKVLFPFKLSPNNNLFNLFLTLSFTTLAQSHHPLPVLCFKYKT